MSDDKIESPEIEPEDANVPEPELPEGVVEVPTDWDPSTDDEMEPEDA